jgi:sugar lactone lactonase YvrE
MIGQVLEKGGWLPFTSTAGRPEGLAFDAAGDLYVADAARKAVLKITLWGEVSPVVENVSPRGIAVGHGGAVYITDPEAGRVYRLTTGSGAATLAGDLREPAGIVVRGTDVFVTDEARTIWRISSDGEKRRFASLDGEGQPAGLALDETGNLYVARRGAGEVSVLSPEGKLIETYTLPGPDVEGLAFGGTDLKTLYVTENSTRKVYKLRVSHRSQPLPWETARATRITEPRDGAILNRHDGGTTEAGLRILVKGRSGANGGVTINGVRAPVQDGRFQAHITLKERETRIVVQAPDGTEDTATVLWDRDSIRRYRFSTDDNIWFLRDIARNADRYESIFENPYMALWRDMHRRYGARIHFNIYYETEGFNISHMPDKFRDEWQQNRDWIRLTFHARANDPDRPYIHASAETIRADFRRIVREIERFAGPGLLSPVTTVHWGEATRAGCRALREEGIRVLVGYFRMLDDIPSVSYYLSRPDVLHLAGRDYWKDNSEDLIFVRHDIVINTIGLEEIEPFLNRLAADPHQSEVMELMIHEQYFYPGYVAYEPDYRDRVERAIHWVTQRGYKSVFFEEGFLGAEH